MAYLRGRCIHPNVLAFCRREGILYQTSFKNHPNKMKTIAIANQKGGTGKTTTTYNLGIALTQQGYRVLMVDFDPQGNLSCYCGIQPEKDLDQTITEWPACLAGRVSDPQRGNAAVVACRGQCAERLD